MDKNTMFPGLAKMLLAVVLAVGIACVGGCKGPGEGDAMAGEPGAEKGPDAVPVEVAKASHRAVAARSLGNYRCVGFASCARMSMRVSR